MSCFKNGGDGEKEDEKKRCQGREGSGHCVRGVLMEKCLAETLKSKEEKKKKGQGGICRSVALGVAH